MVSSYPLEYRLLMATLSKENDSFSPINYLLPLAPQCEVSRDKHPTYARIWAGLIFCKSCADKHSSCESITVVAMPCPKTALWGTPPHSPIHMFFPSHLPQCSLRLSCSMANINVLFKAEYSGFYSQHYASLHWELPTAKRIFSNQGWEQTRFMDISINTRMAIR